VQIANSEFDVKQTRVSYTYLTSANLLAPAPVAFFGPSQNGDPNNCGQSAPCHAAPRKSRAE
jgi:hypothetical protein